MSLTHDLADRELVARELLAGTALEVAPQLLGAVLRHETARGAVSLRLTEVEAYEGAVDPGSHAYRGQTRRNAVMFGPAGHLYVYFTYGMHYCANIVCGVAGSASAVLLRAGEVIEGEDLAWSRRVAAGSVKRKVDLARGPARLTVALGIERSHNGVDLVSGEGLRLYRRELSEMERTSTGPRVGVSGPGGDPVNHPWRFWITDNPTVSTYRKPKQAA